MTDLDVETPASEVVVLISSISVTLPRPNQFGVVVQFLVISISLPSSPICQLLPDPFESNIAEYSFSPSDEYLTIFLVPFSSSDSTVSFPLACSVLETELFPSLRVRTIDPFDFTS